MAAALVARRSRAVVRSVGDMKETLLCLRLRSMSSNNPKPTANEHVYHEHGDQDAKKVWPDAALSFDPYDQMRFPLPGNVAPAVVASLTSSAALLPVTRGNAEVLNNPSRYQLQAEVFAQHQLRQQSLLSERTVSSRSSMDVELKVQDCPLLMRKDFQLLFPSVDVMLGDFTVVSLCQKTTNDMTGWSVEVEEERESLIQLYSETANELCTVLRNGGYWADFLDPCSGKPHLGPHTTDSMFETDERYRHLGFEIEDLGCCKVIMHHKWGSKSFVGCIFTNAPADAPVLVELTLFTQSDSKS